MEHGLFNIDCVEGMKQYPDGYFDLCLTDPPYGIDLGYNSFDDSDENLKEFISVFMPEILRVSKRALITCGTKNIHYYPKPDWILSWISTAGVGCCKWGFTCWQPILAYGKDPYLTDKLGSRPDIIMSNEVSDKTVKFHPCPKPTKLWREILLRGSVRDSDIILDPFMGSGTTAIVCNQTGRKNWVGFEKDGEYFNKAKERIERDVDKISLFEMPVKNKDVQLGLEVNA